MLKLSFVSYGNDGLIYHDNIWTLESDRDGIKLYSHKKPPKDIVPLRGEMTVLDSVEEVIAVFDDKKRRKEWAKRFQESHLLEKTTLYDQVEYTRVVLPLWFSDRTSVAKIKVVVSADFKTIYFFGESTEHPKADKYKRGVRASLYESSIKLEDTGQGTKITMITYADPNGAIPPWVVNLFTESVARNTMNNFRRQLAKDLYSREHLARFTYRIRNYKKFKTTKYHSNMNNLIQYN
jgi:hypothetical protein